MKTIKPTIGGHLPVRIGKTVQMVPQGSRVLHVNAGGQRVAYILFGNHVYLFSEEGQIEMSEEQQARALRSFQPKQKAHGSTVKQTQPGAISNLLASADLLLEREQSRTTSASA